jgi:hypothetical protein
MLRDLLGIHINVAVAWNRAAGNSHGAYVGRFKRRQDKGVLGRPSHENDVSYATLNHIRCSARSSGSFPASRRFEVASVMDFSQSVVANALRRIMIGWNLTEEEGARLAGLEVPELRALLGGERQVQLTSDLQRSSTQLKRYARA